MRISDEDKKLCDISIKYLERMLSGNNPVNNKSIENDTILMDANVQRCFSFIIDMLKRVSTEEQTSARTSRTRVKSVTYKEGYEEVISGMIQDREVTMSELGGLISANLSELFVEEATKISVSKISNWLVEKGYLMRVEEPDGNHHREATEEGKAIGITNNLVQNGELRSYTQYRFTPKAQRFVLEHLREIAMYKKQK